MSGYSLCLSSVNQECSHWCPHNRLESISRDIKGSGFVIGTGGLLISMYWSFEPFSLLTSLLGSDQGKLVHILISNTIAVYNVNKQGEAHFSQLCQELMKLCHFLADHLSSRTTSGLWRATWLGPSSGNGAFHWSTHLQQRATRNTGSSVLKQDSVRS